MPSPNTLWLEVHRLAPGHCLCWDVEKGRLSKAGQVRESDPEFIRLRRQHSAVESAINALEAHGLDVCPDHGMDGFKRYVALAVLARNIQRLGAVLREHDAKRRREGPIKKPPDPRQAGIAA